MGYADGHTRNPSYEEVCSGRAGHTEVELVVIDPKRISYDRLLKTFWESHNPALGMRQRNDVGTPIIPRSIASVTRCANPPTTSSAAKKPWLQSARAASPPRSRPPARSISWRTTTSDIWPRIAPDIVGLAGAAWPARSATASASERVARRAESPMYFARRAAAAATVC